jgi:hypothetical protein
MMASNEAKGVNPAVLKWARESAGISVQQMVQWLCEASYQAEIAGKKSYDLFATEDDVKCFEDGSEHITIDQLEEWARLTRRPLSTFYLPEVPDVTDYPQTVGELVNELMAFTGDTAITWLHNDSPVWRVVVRDDSREGCEIHVLTKEKRRLNSE